MNGPSRCHTGAIPATPKVVPAAVAIRRLVGLAAAALLALLGDGMAADTDLDTPDTATPRSVPAFRQANAVAVLPVTGPIDGVTLISLERRLAKARSEGADAIVLEIDTPGGELLSTLDICHLLKNDAPSNTVAWVHPKAYSAGTIIGLACREIVVSPNASFGDAAPVSPLGPIPETERAKLETPILIEVVDSARRNHYDENLVQAFISVGVELWLLENQRTGERIFTTREEYKSVFGREPPEQMTAVAPPAPGANVSPVRPWINEIFGEPTGQDRPLTDDELVRQKEEQAKQIAFAQQRPSIRPTLTSTNRREWKLVAQVVTDDRLLTVKPAEALHFGLATDIVASEQELQAYFGATSIVRYDEVWSEGLVRVLNSWAVKGILIVVFLVCLFIELAAPGVGIFGAVAGISLLILIGAPYLAGMAQWWDILLILLGLVLVALELFVIPGFGVAGVAGVGCLLVGLVGMFVSDDFSTAAAQGELWTGIGTTTVSLFGAGVIIWFISRQFETLPIFNRLILTAEVRSPGRPGPGTAAAGLLGAMGAEQRALAPGDLGTALTDLRPGGRGEFNGRPVEVQSATGYIDRGTPIRVLEVGQFAIQVEEARS